MKKKQAFTLVELLMLALVTAYVLSVILTTFVNTTALNESSRNLTTATTHAELIMESIKDTAFATIASNITAGVWNWDTAAVTSNGLAALNSGSIAATSSGTNPLTITVTVSWKDVKGRSRSRALMTLMSG